MPSAVTAALRCAYLRCLIAALAFVFPVSSALASASGSTYFGHGAQTVYAGLLPAPGATQFYAYAQFYDAEALRDDDGAAVPGVQAQAIAFAPRVIHTWKQGLWGWNASSGVFALLVNLGVDTPQGEFFDNGPSMFGIEPLYLTRAVGNLHYLIGTVLYIPWGDYDTQSPANSSLNHYSGALNGSLTWMPTQRWDISLNAGYEFKGRNRDTEYRDGAQAGLTYGVGHRPFQDTRWDLGFSGYYTVQVEDDHQSGETVADRRLRKFVIGPKLGYWFNPAAAVILQWHHEYEVRNAGRGDAYWVMFAFPLGS